MEKLSKYIIDGMNQKRKYTPEEKKIIQYGIELFLSSAVKIVLYISLGIIIGKAKESFFALVVWCVVRKQSGGRHAKSESICFVISGSAILGAAIISSFVHFNTQLLIVNVIMINLIYAIYAPYDEYFDIKGHEVEKRVAKYKSILILNLFLIIGLGINEKYLNIVIITLLEQGVLIIHGNNYVSEVEKEL